jgi:hypothetical protein
MKDLNEFLELKMSFLNIISFQIKIKTKTYDYFPFCNLGNLFFKMNLILWQRFF